MTGASWWRPRRLLVSCSKRRLADEARDDVLGPALVGLRPALKFEPRSPENFTTLHQLSSDRLVKSLRCSGQDR
jgi:hypothetical protein